MYNRIPVLVRAIVGGLVVQIVGVMPFMALVQLNMTVLPSIPWSAFVEWILLFLFIKYFRGWGPPQKTAEIRRDHFRANRLASCARPFVVSATIFLGITILLLVVLGNQIVSLPAEAIGAFSTLVDGPPLTAVVILATVALMTGIVEESAFRGYMQVPLEQRYGPMPAILIVALAFSLVHFPPLTILPLFLVGAIGWGVLARLANSTVPGMIAHGLVDFAFFLWILFDKEVVISLLESSVQTTGVDNALLVVIGLTLVFGVGTVPAFRRLPGAAVD
jgi:membrane protease YdiL (CAAX protease family)